MMTFKKTMVKLKLLKEKTRVIADLTVCNASLEFLYLKKIISHKWTFLQVETLNPGGVRSFIE